MATRTSLVARNYAETLLALAQRQGDAAMVDRFGEAADLVVALLDSEPRVRAFLAAPGVAPEQKQRAVAAAFDGRVPPLFLRFLMLVVEKRRESQLRDIAVAYHALVDELAGRVRAEITLAEAPDAALQQQLTRWLEGRIGKRVIASFRVDVDLVAGLVIRVGDEVIDGSIRRSLSELRRRMLNARVPAGRVS